MSPVFLDFSSLCRTPRCPAPLRRVPQPSLIRLQAPRSSFCFGPVPSSLVQRASCAREDLDTGQPFSYRYESRTQLRLESVATRTPPPICASAQGSQTALVSRTAERRERFNNYTMVQF